MSDLPFQVGGGGDNFVLSNYVFPCDFYLFLSMNFFF